MKQITVNFNSFPNHIVSMYQCGHLVGSIEVPDGKEFILDTIKIENIFDEIKLKQLVNKAIDLLEPSHVKIEEKPIE